MLHANSSPQQRIHSHPALKVQALYEYPFIDLESYYYTFFYEAPDRSHMIANKVHPYIILLPDRDEAIY